MPEPARRRAVAAPPGEERRRLRVVAFVVIAVASLLIAGAAVPRAHAVAGRSVFTTGLLPVVDLQSTSSVWNCPGPLPAGTGQWRSSVSMANPGTTATSIMLVIAATQPGTANAAARALPSVTEHLSVPAATERTVALPTIGTATEDAVSVLASGGAIAVSEETEGAGAPLASSCRVGSDTRDLVPLGSTIGSSDVWLALFDPGATPAVADIRVSLDNASDLPPALQGIAVEPRTVVVVDIGRSVVQQQMVALDVTAVAGQLAAGVAEVNLSTQTHTTAASPTALFTGVGATASSWELPPSPPASAGAAAVISAPSVRIFDPGTAPAVVSVSKSAPGGAAASITETVPAGNVVSILVPVPQVPRATAGKSKQHHPLPHATTPALGAPIMVRSAHGVGVVVALAGAPTAHSSGIAATSFVATAAASTGAVLAGSVSTPTVRDALVMSNPGGAVVTVTISELSGSTSTASATGSANSSSGASAPAAAVLGTVNVPAGGGAIVALSTYLSDAPALALVVHCSAPVVLSQVFVIAKATKATAPDGSSAEAIPLVG
jgi:hypothetical protein